MALEPLPVVRKPAGQPHLAGKQAPGLGARRGLGLVEARAQGLGQVGNVGVAEPDEQGAGASLELGPVGGYAAMTSPF